MKRKEYRISKKIAWWRGKRRKTRRRNDVVKEEQDERRRGRRRKRWMRKRRRMRRRYQRTNRKRSRRRKRRRRSLIIIAAGICRLNIREEVHGVTALLDALLPELHEVTQREQGIVADGDSVFRRPGFHGHQDDTSVELLLVDLDTTSMGGENHKLELCSR